MARRRMVCFEKLFGTKKGRKKMGDKPINSKVKRIPIQSSPSRVQAITGTFIRTIKNVMKV